MKQIYFDKFYNTSDNIYDIIIKNVSEDYINMLSKSSKDKWEVPQYSKSQINKAGKTIVDPNASKEDYDNAIKILNNWRASHAYPLQVICSNLRLRNPNAIVVQRLKRLESITGKIERFPDMSLYRMQDLGGCRVIVNDIEEKIFYDKYCSSRCISFIRFTCPTWLLHLNYSVPGLNPCCFNIAGTSG